MLQILQGPGGDAGHPGEQGEAGAKVCTYVHVCCTYLRMYVLYMYGMYVWYVCMYVCMYVCIYVHMYLMLFRVLLDQLDLKDHPDLVVLE